MSSTRNHAPMLASAFMLMDAQRSKQELGGGGRRSADRRTLIARRDGLAMRRAKKAEMASCFHDMQVALRGIASKAVEELPGTAEATRFIIARCNQ
mmetsp:Transcript_65375/g.108619  ORF Transcript_65375/g.108619 Transcript_65375/m.108619 type:complete len:96 (-) Transcript_65375:754-1041(-)